MNFDELSKKVAEATLGSNRMTDIAEGNYTIGVDGEKVMLVSEKKEKIQISVNGLAALRIVEDAAKAKAIATTRDARESSDYSTLQKAVVSEAVKLNDSTQLKVVHRLRIIDGVNDKPIFKNNCYNGYPEFVKASRKASAMPAVSEEQRTERANAFTEATETLRASGVKSGITVEDKNLQLLPVFQVTSK